VIARRCGSWLDAVSRWGTPVFWRRWHAFWAFIWYVSVPPVLLSGLKSSVPYLVWVSLMTAGSGEMAALHGVTVEEQQTAAAETAATECGSEP
jgi:hypothetical protein